MQIASGKLFLEIHKNLIPHSLTAKKMPLNVEPYFISRKQRITRNYENTFLLSSFKKATISRLMFPLYARAKSSE